MTASFHHLFHRTLLVEVGASSQNGRSVPDCASTRQQSRNQRSCSHLCSLLHMRLRQTATWSNFLCPTNAEVSSDRLTEGGSRTRPARPTLQTCQSDRSVGDRTALQRVSGLDFMGKQLTQGKQKRRKKKKVLVKMKSHKKKEKGQKAGCGWRKKVEEPAPVFCLPQSLAVARHSIHQKSSQPSPPSTP